MGGIAYKFKSPNQRGVTDRIVWFVELKTENGKLSMLQKVHAHNLKTLQQNYACLWSTDHIDTWMKENQ